LSDARESMNIVIKGAIKELFSEIGVFLVKKKLKLKRGHQKFRNFGREMKTYS